MVGMFRIWFNSRMDLEQCDCTNYLRKVGVGVLRNAGVHKARVVG